MTIHFHAPLSERLSLAEGGRPAVLEQATEPGDSVRAVLVRLAGHHAGCYGSVLEPAMDALLPAYAGG